MAPMMNCFATLFPRSRKATSTPQKPERTPNSSGQVVDPATIMPEPSKSTQSEAVNASTEATKPAETTEGATESIIDRVGVKTDFADIPEQSPKPVRQKPDWSLVKPRMAEDTTPRIAIRQPTLTSENDASLPRTASVGSLSPRISRDEATSLMSSRSRANSRGSSTAENWLKELLDDACLESPKHHHCSFVPRSAQEELINITNVTQDLQIRNRDMDEKIAIAWATEICERAKRLYATLAYIKKGPEVLRLLEEGFSDDDLPFTKISCPRIPSGVSRMHTKNGVPVLAFDSWAEKHFKKFNQYQWWMSAPVFSLNQEMYQLDSKTILPFVSIDLEGKKRGGYSEVYPVKLHPAHHNFWESSVTMNEEPFVAVKQLFSDDFDEFDKERSILTTIGVKDHPHLIKLLATFKFDGHYHLMFPYANGNLYKYWEDRPNPEFDMETVLWSLKQMVGIASGLVMIHNFRPSRPLSIKGPGNVRIQGNAKLSVERGEESYGRHGDIKPENILWFESNRDASNSKGILQIADFGLGRFHGRDSRSRDNPDTVPFSPTYEPPECKLRQPVSRAYDMWSLGCVYLEFITWLLRGSAEIDGFSVSRLRLATGTGINDDNFFTILTSAGRQRAVVREQVVAWVDELHRHPKCSLLIHDLLQLTMDGLLVIESKDRLPASELLGNLKKCLNKAQDDTDYLLKPAPRDVRPEPERAKSAPESTSTKSGAQPHPVRKLGTHSNQQPSRWSTKDAVHTTLPRDLVLRNSGTPNQKIKTWPTHGSQSLMVDFTP